MYSFENKETKRGIRYSRYIASWAKIGRKYGPVYFNGEFKRWLIMVGCNEEEANEIAELADCGKIELEDTVELFYRNEHVVYSKLLN